MIKRASDEDMKRSIDYWEAKVSKEGYRGTGFDNTKINMGLYYPDLVRKRLEPSKEKTIYEIGSGWGKQTYIFADMFKTVVASDISKTFLNVAAEVCKEKTNIIYCEYPNDLAKLDFQFDCLFSYGTLQYCTDEALVAMFEDIIPHMKDNGKFFLEFQMYHPTNIDQKLNRFPFVDIQRNPHEIQPLLEQVGLVYEGHDFVTSPTVQAWTYGHKKGV